MQILTVSGSSRPNGSNQKLLTHLSNLVKENTYTYASIISELPLFLAENDKAPYTEAVLEWREKVKNADAVIFCIPEYIYNIPALMKNALEWLASSGELVQKKVLALTLTPHSPRGEKAMQSLIWSLTALDARIITSLALYNDEIDYGPELRGEGAEILREAIYLLN